jgi:hypothetical protein
MLETYLLLYLFRMDLGLVIQLLTETISEITGNWVASSIIKTHLAWYSEWSVSPFLFIRIM